MKVTERMPAIINPTPYDKKRPYMMGQSIFKEYMSSEGKLSILKISVRTLGLEMAVFISDLAERDYQFQQEYENYGGWFFSTKNERSLELGLSIRTLERLMSLAINKEFIEVKMKGMPAKQYIKINYEFLAHYIETMDQRGLSDVR